MTTEIDIQLEMQNHGHWVKVFVPYATKENMLAIFKNEAGETIKRLRLLQGNNAIDISQVEGSFIHLHIDTPHEVIFRKIKID